MAGTTTLGQILWEKAQGLTSTAPSPFDPSEGSRSTSRSTSQIIAKDAKSPSLFLYQLPVNEQHLLANDILSQRFRFNVEEYTTLIDQLYGHQPFRLDVVKSNLDSSMSKTTWKPTFFDDDDGNEEIYRSFVEELVRMEASLLTCKILEAWIDVLAIDKTDETLSQARHAVELVVALYVITNVNLKRLTDDQTSVKPDIVIRTSVLDQALEKKVTRNICTIDAKTPAFATYKYDALIGGDSKDGLISTILQDHNGQSMWDIYRIRPDGWRRDTVELIGQCQMSSQCARTESKMCMFTSMYAFCRVGVRQEENGRSKFFVTDNLMPPNTTNSVSQRRSRAVNHRFFCITLLFLLKALLSFDESLFPPKERQMLQDAFRTPSVSISYKMLLWQYFVCTVCSAKSAAQLLLGYFAGIAKYHLTLKFVHVRFRYGQGVFQRVGDCSRVFWPSLEFVAREEENGRLMGFNLVAGLVLKTFSDRELCKKEVDIYKVLSNSAGVISPRFYETYQNKEVGLWGIVLDYAGEPIDDVQFDDLDQIDTLIQRLHACGYHHHDIFPRNFVRGKDKKLRLIDFESAKRAEECQSSIAGEIGLCPDIQWFRESEWTCYCMYEIIAYCVV
ncbi:hypothetical protein CVT26_007848 [Gymnopilus dilepis]|uniref:Protein kinase domain-containing protein n=1 Tax=Gymnopilus dilepis TaxID=231916 RepID=A0A409WEN7_9AGAR|nr:hypothetical protein CVT26_007848 [Gymnopilus dilepis]